MYVIMERWQMDFLRLRRKGNENMLCKYISCGNLIRAKKIWASTVFFCIYFLHLVCICIFLFSGYLSVYPDLLYEIL